MIAALDVLWGGRPGRIAAWRVDDVLIDCGPSASVSALLPQLEEAPLRALVLTHIHLDHAGAAGDLVKRWPDLPVYVHRIGAPHLIDPSRLEASARRVFGPDFDLYGPLTPVPSENIRILDGGEEIFGLRASYTPGHASHHLSYLHGDSATAFPGDVAAARLPGGRAVLPPTPAPDLDVDRWLASVEIVRGGHPDRLALPHFGIVEPVEQHLDAVVEALHHHVAVARSSDQDGYIDTITSELRTSLDSPSLLADYVQTVSLSGNYAGLQRWLAPAAR